MRRMIAALALVGALILTACSPISSGTVTGKSVQPGYYYVQQICAGYDSKGSCTSWMPITHWQPPTWRLTLSQGDEDGWVNVSENAWDRYEVGDYFDGGR